MNLFKCLFIVVFCVSTLLNSYADEKANLTDEEIKSLIEKMKSKFYDDREFAKQKLIEIGAKIEPFILETLKQEGSFRFKKDCIIILKKLKLETSIRPLIDEMIKTDDEELQEIIAEALFEFGDRIQEIINEYLEKEDIKTNEKALKSLENIRKSFYNIDVEKLLLKLIPETGSTGFYDEQFDTLKKLDKKIVLPILIDMVDEEYEFKTINIGDNRRGTLRRLAIEAIGDVADKDDKTTIERLKEYLPDEDDDDVRFASTIYDSMVFTLWKIGEKSYVEKMVKDLEEKMESANESERMFAFQELPFVYTRIYEYEKARDCYLKFIEEYKDKLPKMSFSIVYYNLACIYSKWKKKDEAIDYLNKSIDVGYNDLGWMEMDGDLNFIRDTAEYKEIVEKLKERKEKGDEEDDIEFPEEDIRIEEE